MKWETTVPLPPNSICPLLILAKCHSQLSVPEEIKGGPLVTWLHVQGDYFVVQPSLTGCFVSDFLASGLIYL